jgi:hypothetical protein
MACKIGDMAMLLRSAQGNEGLLVRVVRYARYDEQIGRIFEVESLGTTFRNNHDGLARVPEKWLACWPRSLTRK